MTISETRLDNRGRQINTRISEKKTMRVLLKKTASKGPIILYDYWKIFLQTPFRKLTKLYTLSSNRIPLSVQVLFDTTNFHSAYSDR